MVACQKVNCWKGYWGGIGFGVGCFHIAPNGVEGKSPVPVLWMPSIRPCACLPRILSLSRNLRGGVQHWCCIKGLVPGQTAEWLREQWLMDQTPQSPQKISTPDGWPAAWIYQINNYRLLSSFGSHLIINSFHSQTPSSFLMLHFIWHKLSFHLKAHRR